MTCTPSRLGTLLQEAAWQAGAQGSLQLPNVNILGLAGCNSQPSPGQRMLAPPFPLASVLPTSGIGWIHLALSETAVRDAQIAVETFKLSWRSSVMGRGLGEDLAQALGKSHQSTPLHEQKGRKSYRGASHPREGIDWILSACPLGPGSGHRMNE
jgi:hypothetical protein